MEKVDLGLVIQQTIARFTQNRIGAKPLVFVMISPNISQLDLERRESARVRPALSLRSLAQ